MAQVIKTRVIGVSRDQLKFDDGKTLWGFWIHTASDIYEDKGKGMRAEKPDFLSDDKYPIVCKVENPHDLVGEVVDIFYDKYSKVRLLAVIK